MALSKEDADTLAAMIDEYGYTDVLDEMAGIAQSDIEAWRKRGGARDAIRAIISDLKRTLNALERAAIDARG